MSDRKPKACRICQARLTHPPTGRPRSYCSPTCRKVAEYDIRRLQGHLTRAEREHQRCRLDMVIYGRAPGREDFWAGEVTRLRGELVELLRGQASEVS